MVEIIVGVILAMLLLPFAARALVAVIAFLPAIFAGMVTIALVAYLWTFL